MTDTSLNRFDNPPATAIDVEREIAEAEAETEAEEAERLRNVTAGAVEAPARFVEPGKPITGDGGS